MFEGAERNRQGQISRFCRSQIRGVRASFFHANTYKMFQVVRTMDSLQPVTNYSLCRGWSLS